MIRRWWGTKVWGVLVGTALAACSSTPGGLEFRGEDEPLGAFEHDTGLLPGGSPVQVRAVARGRGQVVVVARGESAGEALTPVAGSGSIQASGGLDLEIHAHVDVSGIRYDGPVHTQAYELPVGSATFDPFLVGEGESVEVQSALPEAELARVPIPSVPGSTLVLGVAGGTVTTRYHGTCAAVSGGRAEYLGALTIAGTVDLSATVEIEPPFGETLTFGPFALSVPIPDIARELDLGTIELASGARVEDGHSPCHDGPVGQDGSVADRDGSVADDGGTTPADGSVGPADGSTDGTDGGAGVDWTVDHLFTVRPGFTPDPQTFDSWASGGDVQLAGSCGGHVGTIVRLQALQVTESIPFLRIAVNGGDDDLTLVVVNESGVVFCSDDAEGRNPMVDGPFPAGIYNLLVGHYRAGTGTTAYRIGISELGSTTPSSIGRP